MGSQAIKCVGLLSSRICLQRSKQAHPGLMASWRKSAGVQACRIPDRPTQAYSSQCKLIVRATQSLRATRHVQTLPGCAFQCMSMHRAT
eukprot:1159462-Pelagomonas_calceolata.AAC.4